VAHLREHGIDVAGYGRLDNVRNIYEESDERAYTIARQVDRPEAEAVFLSGVGMPTLGALEVLERDLGKPVISAASAMMWHALRVSGVGEAVEGYGRLLRER
jgi:maleate cis-trans isomerase